MTKMTAVEWLEKELKDRYSLINSEPLFKQANEMFEQQMIDAAANHCYPTCELARIDAEQYYSETYKKDNL